MAKKDQEDFNKKVFKEYQKIGKRNAAVAFSEDVKKGKAPPSIIGEASTIVSEWGTRKGSNKKAKKAVKNVKLKNIDYATKSGKEHVQDSVFKLADQKDY